MRLDGKVALVTGSSRGLGRAIAETFALAGAAVAVTAHRRIDLGQQVAEGIVARGGRATFHAADLRELRGIEALIDRSVQVYGRIDVLVNNAGVDVAASIKVGEIEDALWDTILQTNLTAPFRLTRAVLPMMHGRGGSIVNIASIAGLKAWPGDAAYNAAKAGLIMLTKTVAAEYARDGIRCNAICPGVVGTDMTWQGAQPDRAAALAALAALSPMDRIGDAEDIAQAALYLASDAARFTTGAILSVDGGMSAI